MTEQNKPLVGRTALITGSGRNLGRGMALAFARAGANVVLNGHRDREALEAVAREVRELGAKALCVIADVSNPDQVQQMVKTATEEFGAVDISVSNAAIRPRQAFLEISVEDWKRVLETNLSASFYLARAVIPGMKERGFGRVIHISGRDGFFTMSHRAHNVTCKAGLHSLAKAIAVEFGEFGITANTIAPGKMDTARDEKNYPGYKELWPELVKSMPLRRLGTAEDIGDAALFLATGGAYVTGQLLHMNGGEFVY
jgi:3-oxoacyl-[acyl-carrier protein] reductase